MKSNGNVCDATCISDAVILYFLLHTHYIQNTAKCSWFNWILHLLIRHPLGFSFWWKAGTLNSYFFKRHDIVFSPTLLVSICCRISSKSDTGSKLVLATWIRKVETNQENSYKRLEKLEVRPKKRSSTNFGWEIRKVWPN